MDPEVAGDRGADRALPGARLLLTLERPGTPVPPGWERTLDRRSLRWARRAAAVLGDFRAVAFVDPAARQVVVAIPGTRVNVRGIIAVLRRRIFGGASGVAAAFVALARTRYPGFEVLVVGHSSGGGTASYIGALLGLPTITFNGARTRAALRNGGAGQLNVIVRGDFWGDPHILPGRLRGETIWLEGDGIPGPDRHAVATIVRLLERRADPPAPQ